MVKNVHVHSRIKSFAREWRFLLVVFYFLSFPIPELIQDIKKDSFTIINHLVLVVNQSFNDAV